MTENPANPTLEEVTAAYEAVRQAQAAQRVMVSQAAWNMGTSTESTLCSDGINRWLRDHGCPPIPDFDEDEDGTFNAEVALDDATRLIPGLQDAEMYSPLGLQRQIADRERTGAIWLTTMVRDLERIRREYSESITLARIQRLTRQLRGEPEPEAAQVPESPAASTAPRPGTTNITMAVTLTLNVPTSRINGATQQQITAAAEGTIGNALRTAIQGSQYGARLAGTPEFTTAISQG